MFMSEIFCRQLYFYVLYPVFTIYTVVIWGKIHVIDLKNSFRCVLLEAKASEIEGLLVHYSPLPDGLFFPTFQNPIVTIDGTEKLC